MFSFVRLFAVRVIWELKWLAIDKLATVVFKCCIKYCFFFSQFVCLTVVIVCLAVCVFCLFEIRMIWELGSLTIDKLATVVFKCRIKYDLQRVTLHCHCIFNNYVNKALFYAASSVDIFHLFWQNISRTAGLGIMHDLASRDKEKSKTKDSPIKIDTKNSEKYRWKCLASYLPISIQAVLRF